MTKAIYRRKGLFRFPEKKEQITVGGRGVRQDGDWSKELRAYLPKLMWEAEGAS